MYELPRKSFCEQKLLREFTRQFTPSLSPTPLSLTPLPPPPLRALREDTKNGCVAD